VNNGSDWWFALHSNCLLQNSLLNLAIGNSDLTNWIADSLRALLLDRFFFLWERVVSSMMKVRRVVSVTLMFCILFGQSS
jgi:hypothetical protein